MCLLCEKKFSNESMNRSRHEVHLKNIHPAQRYRELSYFQDLRKKINEIESILSIMANKTEKADDGLVCSYNI